VVVGAGAKVLGAITIGSDSRIGANAVVVKPVPPNSVVVGVPGQIVVRSKPHTAKDAPDLDHTRLPDTVGASLLALMSRVDELEKLVDGHVVGDPHLHAPEEGVWHGEDFTI
jgi:serine O-acetyltransferase